MKLNLERARHAPPRLQCKCGNKERFIEVMRFESHLVDGNLNYLHLLDAETDHYTCPDCGDEIRL